LGLERKRGSFDYASPAQMKGQPASQDRQAWLKQQAMYRKFIYGDSYAFEQEQSAV
jgi:hypothetical protein